MSTPPRDPGKPSGSGVPPWLEVLLAIACVAAVAAVIAWKLAS